MDVNPYAPITTSALDSNFVDMNNAEAIRRLHLSREANIKSVGGLYIFGAIIVFLYGVLIIGAAIRNVIDPNNYVDLGLGVTGAWAIFGIGGIVAALGLIQFWGGLCMWRLRPSGRPWAIFVAAVGLINVPIGTLISLAILWMLLSAKGRMVFSPAYREVIQATPHIKYRTSIIVWIFLILLLAVIAVGVFGVLLLGA